MPKDKVFLDTNNLRNRVVTRNGTHIEGSFVRDLVTGDTNDRPIIPSQNIKIAYACHTRNTIESSGSVPKHLMTGDLPRCGGTKLVQFGRSTSCDTSSDGGSFTSPAGDFKLQFKLSETGDSIDFIMEGNTAGWVGFGWSEGPTTHVDTGFKKKNFLFRKLNKISISFELIRHVRWLGFWRICYCFGYLVYF